MNNELENLKKREQKLIKKLNKIAKRDRIMEFFYDERDFLSSYNHGRRIDQSIAGCFASIIIIASLAVGLILSLTNPWMIAIAVGGVGMGVGIHMLPAIVDKFSINEIWIKTELERVQTRIEAIEKGITVEELLEQRKEEKKQQEILKELQEEKERQERRIRLLQEAEKRRTLKTRAEGLLADLETSDKKKADKIRKKLAEVEELGTTSNTDPV